VTIHRGIKVVNGIQLLISYPLDKEIILDYWNGLYVITNLHINGKQRQMNQSQRDI
jgi:hypothetical protein